MLGIYLPIPGFTDYLIGLDGRVFSTKTNKYLSPYLNNKMYLCIHLNNNGVQHGFLIHRLLFIVFNPRTCIDGLDIDHKIPDKLYIGLNNLQALSKQEHKLKTMEDNGYTLSIPKKCRICNAIISKNATHCQKCSSHKSKNPDLTITEIESAVSNFGWVKAGKLLNYSDNGLRKKYKSLGGNPKTLKKKKKKIRIVGRVV